MRSSLCAVLGLAYTLALAPILAGSGLVGSARASDRALPMRFELRLPQADSACGTSCKYLIVASGAITAETPRDFRQFMQAAATKGRDLKAATVVLDSDGGSVLGAIALGRAIRKAALDTTVGRAIDVAGETLAAGDIRRTVLSQRADCESMCAFVLLGGVQRTVPAGARVMVHQIWLGDRRDDPTAASYSAEDLVLVQRDIGRLAQFTAEMGASMDLLDLTLRIPPWEPLHAMTREEIRRTKLTTDVTEPVAPSEPATVAATPPAPRANPDQPMTSGTRATPISERRWGVINGEDGASLARRHPLTVEGDIIGSFDLIVSCGSGDSFELSYVERRHGGDSRVVPAPLDRVSLRIGRNEAPLKIVSSERRGAPNEVVSYATASVPAAMVSAFSGPGSQSMVVETTSRGVVTVIRLGNTGARQSLPQIAATCAKPIQQRAELQPVKAVGMMADNMAAAQ